MILCNFMIAFIIKASSYINFIRYDNGNLEERNRFTVFVQIIHTMYLYGTSPYFQITGFDLSKRSHVIDFSWPELKNTLIESTSPSLQF